MHNDTRRTRPLVATAQRIDALDLIRWFRPGCIAGGTVRGTIVTARVDLTGAPKVHLTDYAAGYLRTQTVDMTSTQSSVGGARRWWFICPTTMRKARVLYRPPGQDAFTSRQACGLAYRSQRQSPAARAQERARAAAVQLGATFPAAAPPARPKGMHGSTFARLLAIMRAAPDA